MSRVLVIDASVVVDLLARYEPAPLEQLIFASGTVLVAPALLDVEVLQVLRRLDQTGAIPASRADVLGTFQALRIRRYPHEPLLDVIWQLRPKLSAYDTAYVALARLLGAELVTRDRRLARAPGLEIGVLTP